MIFIELGYDSDLIIDEDDYQKLNKLPQIEKEKIMDKRREDREQLLKKFEFAKKC